MLDIHGRKLMSPKQRNTVDDLNLRINCDHSFHALKMNDGLQKLAHHRAFKKGEHSTCCLQLVRSDEDQKNERLQVYMPFSCIPVNTFYTESILTTAFIIKLISCTIRAIGQ